MTEGFCPKTTCKKTEEKIRPTLFEHVKHDALEYSDTCGKERKVQTKKGKFVFIKEIPQKNWVVHNLNWVGHD
jgi:hypothetical protein